MGKILEVDLTSGSIKTVETNPDDARNFLGGNGLGAKILWDRLKDPGVDPLGPDNIFMIMLGPLTGTSVPGGSRFVTVCKSPLTAPLNPPHPKASGISYATGGGAFAPELKMAGYDGIIVTGKSPKPVYLFIDDDKVELRDASHLWGKGTDQTDILMRQELGDDFRTVMVGPAGENAVPMACVVTESTRAAGRAGTGAVMGSKNLKAIAVRGSKVVPLADAKSVMELRRKMLDNVPNWGRIARWRRWGTTSSLTSNNDLGLWATKNHREGSYEGHDLIAGPIVEETFWVRHRSCVGCPMYCMKLGVVPSGPYKGTIAEGPEYESGTMLGSNLLMKDLYGEMKVIAVADDLGLDNISAGNVIGFVMEAYEKGLVTKSDLGGVEATWGNVEATIELLNMMAYKKGFGEVMGRGTRAVADKVGGDSRKFAMEVKNHGFAAHGTQANPPRAIGYATANRGACHLVAFDPKGQNSQHVDNALVICRFVSGSAGGPNVYVPVLNAITGWNLTVEQYMEIGERIWNLEKMFNVRNGFRREDDYMPDRVFTEPLTYGPKKGAVLVKDQFTQSLEQYYKDRGWDVKTSVPTPDKLRSLGLNDAAELAASLL